MSAQAGGRNAQKQDGKGRLQGRTDLKKKTDFVEEDASLKQPCVLDNGMENVHVCMQISKKLVKFELVESSATNHLISGSFTLIFCVFSFYKVYFCAAQKR